MKTFQLAIDHIFSHEPVYYTDGEITFKHGMPIYPKNELDKSIECLTDRDIIEMYYAPIWNLSNIAFIPEELHVIYFDCCLLAAESEAIRILQRMAGRVVTSGKMDIRTANKLKDDCQENFEKVKRNFCSELSKLYARITKFSDFYAMETRYQSRLYDSFLIKTGD